MRARAESAYARAVEHLETRQRPDGAFAGEVIWNAMLVCQWVIVGHILGREIPEDRKRRVRLSLERQVVADGGWGMHPDSESYLFHTTLAYVALRLLGAPASDPLAAGALRWIQAHGGVYTIPTWGRIWLALLGLYPWHAVQPIPPELWLLPRRSPVHPWRLYCHTRLIYLGLSYLYGTRFVAPRDEILAAIANELYPDGYDETRLEHHRDEIAATDLFEAPGRGLRAAFQALRAVDRFTPGALRRRALAAALEHILFELRSTDHVCLSPVNGLLFCLALHVAGRPRADVDRAMEGMEYWFWEDDVDGLRIAGARSDIWDTSFAIQALSEGPDLPRAREIVGRAAAWLRQAQLGEDIPGGEQHHRSPAAGGWGFADERHPWPVSDCTAEALEALLRVEKTLPREPEAILDLDHKVAAVRLILDRQNDDGGFGSYESRRGSMVLRHFNPAEMYGNCMVEYSYTECSASCVRGLAHAQRELGRELPDDLRRRVRQAIGAGARFLLDRQHESGGWLGFWGINLTYGTFFAVSGLLSSGMGRNHTAISRACRWLVEAQRPDGGWGESFVGMLEERDVRLPEGEPSLAAQTAWALLCLLEAAPHEREVIDRGIGYLVSLQNEDGSWPKERASGCFFNTAALDYTMYRNIFSTWALARYLSVTA